MCRVRPVFFLSLFWLGLLAHGPGALAETPQGSAVGLGPGVVRKQTTFTNAGELAPGAQALLGQRFAGWQLEWVANVRAPHVLYSIVYGTGEPRSAMILTATDEISGASRILKADNSLFPFDEHRTGTPPLEVRIALAEALIKKNSAPFGSVGNYVTALRHYDMIRYLAPEQRQAIINLGGRLPKI